MEIANDMFGLKEVGLGLALVLKRVRWAKPLRVS